MSNVTNSHYLYQGTDLIDLTAVKTLKLSTNITTFNLSDYNFKTTGNNSFISKDHTNYAAWASNKYEILAFSKNGTYMPFITKASASTPEVWTSGDHYVPLETITSSTSTLYVRYNSTAKRCEYNNTGGSGTWHLINNFEGIFVALQGGGGGGGEGSALNLGISADCSGGGGGGGGGFIVVYLNLASVPNTVLTLVPGTGGAMGGPDSDHACPGRGANGTDGGNSAITYNGTNIAYAYGGKGGTAANAEESKTNYGGAGGSTWMSNAYPSLICKLCDCDGGKGGRGADNSGYAFGIPFGHKAGYKGMYGADTTLYMGITTDSVPTLRYGSPWSAVYASGYGQPSYDMGTYDYTSGGGGGGGSICSQNNGNIEHKTDGKPTLFGYGAGGCGGPAEPATVHGAQNGSGGGVFILSAQSN